MENQTAKIENIEAALFDPRKKPNHLVKIECKNCGNVEEPIRWAALTFIGLAYLFLGLNFFVLILILLVANPYICVKCRERNKLTKILNNGKRIPIKSLSRKTFLSISIAGLIVIGLIIISIAILNNIS